MGVLAGHLFIIPAVLAWYTASALLLQGVFMDQGARGGKVQAGLQMGALNHIALGLLDWLVAESWREFAKILARSR